ncbi:hypothetical protein BDV96DRAFT_649918 [Lophiotrema nucula]|uniref:Uncharacterized protein n=1 Tax=Lophiotrema nucula TaxID=690887 RepID=A0A6A5YW64_9PLEO|nr:hypothetical protein BDV96DRAFT_649918 [Lophiotrema nucula]
MADAGFGGAEIEDVHHSVEQALDPEGHGWGTKPWIDAVTAALDQASHRGLKLDIAVGPSWPAAMPSITPDDTGAAVELVHGRAIVNGTEFNGTIPGPFQIAGDGVTQEDLYVVQAWRINNASSASAKQVVLDKNSLVDLTSQVSNTHISWLAPDDQQWILLSYRVRGTGQLPEAGPHTVPPAYVVDHFSDTGARVVTNYWTRNIIGSRMQALLRTTARSFFEDSLEMEATTFWTRQFPSEFKKRMGYSVLEILPVILRENEKQVFTFEDTDVARGALNDYWSVLGDLYTQQYVKTLEDWAHGYGMTLRVQPYGLQTDAMQAAAYLDISEGETLGFKNLDDWLSLAGAAHLAGKNIISDEAAGVANGAYSVTWKDVLRIVNPTVSAGVNQQVFHGFSYAAAPGAEWPGFAAFSPYGSSRSIGYGESWGPRQPQWEQAPALAGYYGRVQYMMRKGTAKVDVGFYRQKGYVASGFGASYFTSDGANAGFSHDIITRSLLDLPLAKVRNGHLAPEGPDYKLLSFEGDAFSSSVPVLEKDISESLLAFAKAGLPMLVVGDWSGAEAYGLTDFPDSDKIKSNVQQLLAQPNVVNVATRNDMASGVAQLGLKPSISYVPASAVLRHHHRIDGQMDHYFFVANSKTAGVDVDVVLPRTNKNAVPFLLDAWTGSISLAALYTEESDGRIKMHMSLQPGQSALVTLAPPLLPLPHAISTTAMGVHRSDTGLLLVARSNRSGTFETKLSNGRTVRSQFRDVPAAITLDKWHLSVKSYEPGSSPTETTYRRIELNLSQLRVWTNITQLQDVSGVGTYSAAFNMPSSSSSTGATLQLSPFVGSFSIRLNGHTLPPSDQLALEVDLGTDYLKTGENTIEIDAATTLLNRLRVSQSTVFGIATPQAYGLVGPVRIVPYKEATIL